MGHLLLGGLVVISLILTIQASYTLYMMLYTWDQTEADQANRAPEHLAPASLSFTAIIPARHEEEVIARTIDRVVRSNYPAELLQAIIVCSADDTGTIDRADEKLKELAREGITNAELVIFDDQPINKPHGLNKALSKARHDVVTIFDAEDETHPDIFRVVNTVMVRENVNVVQSGVQLMNYRSNWYSTFNVLEYFFWFKSRLHFHAAAGMIPLGGNTVFVRRRLLEELGGWDEGCLTEDAEIGIRLSVLGERIRVVYDAQRVTREETPATVGQLIRQRTRWSQGFLQVLRKGAWRRLPRLSQRLLALYTLSYPLLQAALLLLWPLLLPVALWLALPLPVTIASFLPLYVLLLQFVATALGALLFTREYGFRLPALMPVGMALTFLPYQWLLGLSALRAVYRELRREQSWEKTAHTGAHREPGAGRELEVGGRELEVGGQGPGV